jgi:hypothetical protein
VDNVSLGEVVYNSMAAGQGDVISWSPGFLPSGMHSYRFTLDVYDTVNESSEPNNAYFGYLTIP